jgi:hypothetical protein
MTTYEVQHMADNPPRPTTIACARCGRTVAVAPMGRVPVFCCDSCRAMHFATNKRGIRVTPELRQRMRTWELLKDAGVIALDAPLPPKRKPKQE